MCFNISVLYFENWNENIPSLDKMTIKGDTIIENDVWIGQNSKILPGVKIGNGAIIGTESVVEVILNHIQ
jgi:virginiamycin A acetyltransferase